MDIWETDAAISGSDAEIELQEAGWEPFGGAYVSAEDDADAQGYFEVFYRRKKEGLAE